MTKLFLKNKKKNSRGFTIMEMMVAIAVFLIVITAGMGALLNSYRIHKKSQGMHSIMDNLTFVMEDMSRSLRVGSIYNCSTSSSIPSITTNFTPSDCSDGNALYFKNSEGIFSAYFINGSNGIQKSDGNSTAELVPDGININPGESSFTVIGSTQQEIDGSGDSQQPLVIIKLSGEMIYQGTTTPFSLRTIVSQRTLDIKSE